MKTQECIENIENKENNLCIGVFMGPIWNQIGSTATHVAWNANFFYFHIVLYLYLKLILVLW